MLNYSLNKMIFVFFISLIFHKSAQMSIVVHAREVVKQGWKDGPRLSTKIKKWPRL